jgi:hemolysin activation/secretion protein
MLAVTLTGSLIQAEAQLPPAGSDGPLLGPRETRPPLPEFTKPVEPDIGLPPAIPPAPSERRTPRLSEEPALFLRGVRFEGNTVVGTEELVAIAADFVGRLVSAEDLQELRYRLTEAYVNKGYINSGAVLPDQDGADGTGTSMSSS